MEYCPTTALLVEFCSFSVLPLCRSDDIVGAISKYAHVWHGNRAGWETAPTVLDRLAQILSMSQRAKSSLTEHYSNTPLLQLYHSITPLLHQGRWANARAAFSTVSFRIIASDTPALRSAGRNWSVKAL